MCARMAVGVCLAALLSTGCDALLGIGDHSLASDAAPPAVDSGGASDAANLDEAPSSDADGARMIDALSAVDGAPDAPPADDASDALALEAEAGAADAQADAQSGDAGGLPDGGLPDGFACPTPVDPTMNLLKSQPSVDTWYDNFSTDGTSVRAFMTPDRVCGQNATRWTEQGVPTSSSIDIFVDETPFNAGLTSGQTYTATLAVTGTAPGVIVFMSVWDGDANNTTSAVVLSPDAPIVFTQGFVAGNPNNRSIQLNWTATPGSTATTTAFDVYLWNVAIE